VASSPASTIKSIAGRILDFGRATAAASRVQLMRADAELYPLTASRWNQFGADYARELRGSALRERAYATAQQDLVLVELVVTVAEVDFDELSDGRVNGALDAIDSGLVALEGRHVKELQSHGRPTHRFGAPSGGLFLARDDAGNVRATSVLSCLRKTGQVAT